MLGQIRSAVGKVLVTLDRLNPPKSLVRPPEYQERVDRETGKLALYQIPACPFCIKVRRSMKRMNLNIELRDIQSNEEFRDDLLQGGGMYQAPCLKIQKDDGSIHWMYESSDIIRYLRERYAE